MHEDVEGRDPRVLAADLRNALVSDRPEELNKVFRQWQMPEIKDGKALLGVQSLLRMLCPGIDDGTKGEAMANCLLADPTCLERFAAGYSGASKSNAPPPVKEIHSKK